MAFKVRRSDEPANVSLIACGASVSVGCTAWKIKRIKGGALKEGGGALKKGKKKPGRVKTVRREGFANLSLVLISRNLPATYSPVATDDVRRSVPVDPRRICDGSIGVKCFTRHFES